ncbi:MAG: hypothetical protein ACKON7_08460 [Planctomycetaceae bacterium]
MSHRKPNQWPFSRSRTALISEADTLFAQAKHYVAKAEVYPPPHWFHRRAADTFFEAAQRYQEAGLGLMAKVLFGYAKDCYARNGQAERASQCGDLVKTLAVHWGRCADE